MRPGEIIFFTLMSRFGAIFLHLPAYNAWHGVWEAGIQPDPPRKLGVRVVTAPRKLDGKRYTPQKLDVPVAGAKRWV